MMSSEPLHPRVIFSASTLLLAFAGIGIVILNTWSQNSSAIKLLSLARSMWRFEPKNAKVAILKQQRLAWYKLLLAGLMMATLVISLGLRFMPPFHIISIGALVWVVWTAYLFHYWNQLMADRSKDASSPDAGTKESSSKEKSDSAPPAGWKRRRNGSTDGEEDQRLPVTIVTGFLGSGKTTLVKEILNNTVGMKVLVIENEIGTEGIDHDLLMQHTAKEEIILLNNGCICCNGMSFLLFVFTSKTNSYAPKFCLLVRSDLLSTFRKMFANEAFAYLDWIVIETTGLADPAPLIQSFYMDSECQQRMRLDSVLAVVDCKHLPIHLAQHQYDQLAQKAFKDVKSKNGAGAHGGIPEAVLQVSFADKVLMNKTDLVTSKELAKLKAQLLDLNPYADILTCQFGRVDVQELLNVKAFDPKRFSNTYAAQHYDDNKFDRPILVQRDAQGKILKKQVRVDFSGTTNTSSAMKKEAQAIRTISLVTTDAIDLDKFNIWMSKLMQTQGANIYRLKGILHMKNYDEQFVCHCVHMIFDGTRGAQWTVPPEERKSKLVVIGKDLLQEQWENEFSQTLCSE